MSRLKDKFMNLGTGDSDTNADDFAVRHTPQNYTTSGSSAEDHIIGIDTALGNITGNGATTVSLSNNATTNIVNFSSYHGGSVLGRVYVNATANFMGMYDILICKKASTGDYIGSPSLVTGDVDPGVVVDVSVSGVLQITLPNISGFSTAEFKYKVSYL
jgi:hypothetical protein